MGFYKQNYMNVPCRLFSYRVITLVLSGIRDFSKTCDCNSYTITTSFLALSFNSSVTSFQFSHRKLWSDGPNLNTQDNESSTH